MGGLLICFGAFFLLMGLARLIALHTANKEKRQELASERKREKRIDDALKAFQNKTDFPEPNTIKIADIGLEFFAEGRYVCKKDFKNVPGHHFAFEINSTGLKHKPDGFDDVCDLEENGVLVAAGYHDGEALEEYANNNGIVLRDAVQNSVAQTITLGNHKGYALYVWTAEGDEVDFGFVKILKCENDVLTVYFLLDVPYGLDDTVEGTVELKLDTDADAHDIHSLINKIKRKRYNVIEVNGDDADAIKQENPFLPESYIEFLKEIGFADMDWIDVGRNAKTPTNLDDDEIKYLNEILADYKGTDVNDFYFIALDSSDTYYALSRKPGDEKVYIFSNDSPHIGSYENFEEFLTEILDA